MKNRTRLFNKQPFFIVISICMILFFSAGGYWLYSREALVIREARYSELKAIAELKANQIISWRNERQADAFKHASGLISFAFTQWIKTPEDALLKNIILERMETLKNMEGYDDLILADTNGDVLISVNPSASALDVHAKQWIAQTVSTSGVVFGDLFRCTICGRVHIDVMATVYGPGGRPAAILILRSDPETYLFPLIQSWPTPSRSSETLIVRKEGDNVLFLNTLRHHTESAVLNLRFPLSQTAMPEVQAALGREGYFKGMDYRGVEVIADLHAIPGSSWMMVAKVDSSEILAEVSTHRNVISLFVCLFIVQTVTMTAFFYNYRERTLYHKLFRAERGLREIQEELGATLYSIADGVISTNASGSVNRMNPVAEQLTGWHEVEALNNPLEQVFRIISELTRAEVKNPAERVVCENSVIGLANQTLLISRDGTERPIAYNCAPIRNGKGKITGVVLIFRDRTERKQAEEALATKQLQLEEFNLTLEKRIQEAVAELRQKDQIMINQSRLAAMGEMIGNIAHQWRQPLNALGLLIYNIKDAFQFNTLNAEYLDQAVADGNRMVQNMSTTISDFSNFFRPDKEFVAFSATKQIRAAILLVESSYKNSDIAIHLDAPNDLELMGFPNEYSQVLLNLLSNAKEAVLGRNQLHQQLSRRVEIRLTERDGYGCVTVADNGGGISALILDMIFDPYFSTKDRGSGIGLYMSKMIIERNMYGSITARNIEEGAEFTVCTPLATADLMCRTVIVMKNNAK
ncbi:MAG: ATP-binding protein [Deltaproteobacteria bacterium]